MTVGGVTDTPSLGLDLRELYGRTFVWVWQDFLSFLPSVSSFYPFAARYFFSVLVLCGGSGLP